MVASDSFFHRAADRLTHPAVMISSGIAFGVDLIVAANARPGRLVLLDYAIMTFCVGASGFLNIEKQKGSPPRELKPVEERPERFALLETLHSHLIPG